MHLCFHYIATRTGLNVSPHLSLHIAHFDVEVEFHRSSQHPRRCWCGWYFWQAIKEETSLGCIHKVRLILPFVNTSESGDLEPLVPTYSDPCQNYRIIPPGQVLHHWEWNSVFSACWASTPTWHSFSHIKTPRISPSKVAVYRILFVLWPHQLWSQTC